MSNNNRRAAVENPALGKKRASCISLASGRPVAFFLDGE